MSPCCLLLKLTAAVFFILTTRWMCFLLELTQLNSAKGFMVSFPNLLKILRPHKHYTSYISIHISVVYTREEPAERQHLFLRFNQMVNALLKPKYTSKQKQNFKSRYYHLQQIKNNSLLHVGLVKVEIFIIVLSQVAIELS